MFKNLNTSALGVAGHQSEIIELALTYGFQGLDLDLLDFCARAATHGVPYARRLIDSANILVGTFKLPLEWDTNDDDFKEAMRKLPDYAKTAAEIGCTRCIATVSPAGDKRPYHENFEFHRRRFTEICQVLGPVGVRLGVGYRAAENLRKGQAFQFIHDMDALSLLCSMVDAANIGVLLDVWNMHLSGGSVETIRRMPIDQVVAVQLADVPQHVPLGELTEEHRLLPGSTGGIGIPPILTALAELGYDGPVTPKPHNSAFKSTRRDEIVKETGSVLDALWKAAGLTPQGKLAATAES